MNDRISKRSALLLEIAIDLKSETLAEVPLGDLVVSFRDASENDVKSTSISSALRALVGAQYDNDEWPWSDIVRVDVQRVARSAGKSKTRAS